MFVWIPVLDRLPNMKNFRCDNCSSQVYFENIKCLTCGSILGIIPESYEVHSVKADLSGTLKGGNGKSYRFCKNSIEHDCCNQLVLVEDPSDYCWSCQFTEMVPNLTFEVNRELWVEMEMTKRRLLFSLFQLGIQPVPKSKDPINGLSFRFLVDNGQEILTGHEEGMITITLAEADDALREARRQQMGEEYRTLLGHFRHEIGHFYWDQLIMKGGRLNDFRALFGDESPDYGMALRVYYARFQDDSWKSDYISRYASAHPWEDWAETFAHFLHMRDVLETSVSVGLIAERDTPDPKNFEMMMKLWLSVSFRINQIGRSIGSGDLYPFVLNDKVISKMKFIHSAICGLPVQ